MIHKDVLGQKIDQLRKQGNDELADILQFGEEGKDFWDGCRCKVCFALAGGDRRHRCWSSWYRFKHNIKMKWWWIF